MKKLLKILIPMLILLTSCKGINFVNQKTSRAEEFSFGEAMVFVVEEKNKYESRFGNEVWNLKSGNNKLYFKDYVLDNVKKFVEKLMEFKLISEAENLTINDSDMEKLENAANKYYKELTTEDFSYMHASFNDVKKAFVDYHNARLVIDVLSREATEELSISEAKVIKVQYIVFDEEKKAKEVKEKLKARGAQFSYFAKTRSLDTEIEMIIKRGDELSTLFPELFYLSRGEESEILSSYGKFYIFKCIDDYMVEETEDRRIEILKAMKNNEFKEKYEKYGDEYQVKSNSEYWETINLGEGEGCTIYDFENIYYEYFPKNIK